MRYPNRDLVFTVRERSVDQSLFRVFRKAGHTAPGPDAVLDIVPAQTRMSNLHRCALSPKYSWLSQPTVLIVLEGLLVG